MSSAGRSGGLNTVRLPQAPICRDGPAIHGRTGSTCTDDDGSRRGCLGVGHVAGRAREGPPAVVQSLLSRQPCGTRFVKS